MGFEKIGQADQQFVAAETDRAFAALLLLQRGFSLPEIARVLPWGREPGRAGVSVKTAEIIVRQGARSLLSLVVMNRPTVALPAELWPPEEVREAILAEHRGRSHRPSLSVLRAWIEGQQ